MATRSVVGRYIGENAWIGRYVHWDGYPAGMVPVLLDIVLRDGIDKALDTLIWKNYSWSSLWGSDKPEYSKAENYVDGYGEVHPDVKSSEWITWEGDHWGTEYAYIFEPTAKSVTILKRVDNEWTKFDLLDFGPPIFRVKSDETTIAEEITKLWQNHSVFAGLMSTGSKQDA